MSSKKKRQVDKPLLYIIPVIVAMALVPLILRVDISEIPVERVRFQTKNPTVTNIYTFYKSLALNVTALAAFALLFWRKLTNRFRWRELNIRSYYLLYAYMVLVVLSYIFTTDRFFSTVGYLDHHENFFVLMAYIVVFIYTSVIMETEREFKVVIRFWIASILIMAVIGFSQFIGHNLLLTDFYKFLIVPGSMRANTNFNVNIETVSQTLFNPNYVSFYAATAMPFFFTLALVDHSWKRKGLYAALSAVLLFNIFASGSRNGLVGVAVALVVVFLVMIFSSGKYRAAYIGILSVAFVSLVLFVSFSDMRIASKVRLMFTQLATTEDVPLNRILTEEDRILIDDDAFQLVIQRATEPGMFPYLSYDSQGNPLGYEQVESKYNLVPAEGSAGDYSQVQAAFFKLPDKSDRMGLLVFIRGRSFPFVYEDGRFYFLTSLGFREILRDVPAFGFEGRERLGSSRGYIWSRTLPLFKDYWLLGSGPDTFPLVFPQHDHVGKANFHSNANISVDKPHSMLFNYAVNTGIPSLIVLLVFWGIYLVSSMKLYLGATFESFYGKMGFASLAGVVGYLAASLFNDTNVNVTPVFWVLLGMGFAANRLYRKELKL